MKTGIITFHAAVNYGSALQAFALQEFLRECGQDVQVIDFRSMAQRRLYPSPLCFNSIYNAKQSLRRIVSGWNEIRDIGTKIRLFNKFISGNLHLTRRFSTEGQLRGHDWSEFDIIVSGSDQIWNPKAMDFSPAYFIDFADKVKKVAYAPSMGRSVAADTAVPAGMKRLLSEYAAVSVRENEAADFLVSRGLVPPGCVSVMPDPVLLHDAGFYRKVADRGYEELPEGRGEYILSYSPGKADPAADFLADAVSAGMMGKNASGVLPQGKRMRVIKVSDGAVAGQSGCLPCGPAGFLALVDNAVCTVGTSFHLMVFSLLFGKDFWCPDAASDSRKVQLLSGLGLSADTTFFPFGSCSVRSRLSVLLPVLRSRAADFFRDVIH